MKFDSLSNTVINCAIEVHKYLGPGLLESTYEHCLAFELTGKKVPFKLQHTLPVLYKDQKIECGYRIDLLIDEKLIVELKSVESLLPIHEAQLLTYLKLSEIKIGLLINFNEKLLKNGIRRFVI